MTNQTTLSCTFHTGAVQNIQSKQGQTVEPTSQYCPVRTPHVPLFQCLLDVEIALAWRQITNQTSDPLPDTPRPSPFVQLHVPGPLKPRHPYAVLRPMPALYRC